MTEPGRSVATDPGSYTHRDLLLFTQLLHTSGLITPAQVKSCKTLDYLAENWYTHKSTVLSRRQNQFPLNGAPSGAQVLKLYENLLEDNFSCATTTDLANRIYFLRIGELEGKIFDYKTEFNVLLNN